MTKRIWMVGGPKGSGKSTAVARFARPSEISKMIVIDTEDSMNAINAHNEELGVSFGKYINMYERLGKDGKDLLAQITAAAQGGKKMPWVNEKQKGALSDYYLYYLMQMDQALKEKNVDGTPKYTILGIDTIEPIEAARDAWVDSNKSSLGWDGTTNRGAREVQAVRPLYESELESFSKRGIKDIVISSHLKAIWEGEGKNTRRVLNKVQMGGRLAIFSKLTVAMFWLFPSVGNEDGAPAAAVLKFRTDNSSINEEEDEWNNFRAMPQRIPHFSWRDVRRYMREGCNHKNPAPGETLTKSEQETISEFLNDDQMRLMVLGAEKDLELTRQEGIPLLGNGGFDPNAILSQSSLVVPTPSLDDEAVANITKLHEEKNSPVQISQALSIPLPKIIAVTKGLN